MVILAVAVGTVLGYLSALGIGGGTLLTTGTGASGEMRSTVPYANRSSIKSPIANAFTLLKFSI